MLKAIDFLKRQPAPNGKIPKPNPLLRIGAKELTAAGITGDHVEIEVRHGEIIVRPCVVIDKAESGV